MYLGYIFHLDYEIELIIFDIILHHIEIVQNILQIKCKINIPCDISIIEIAIDAGTGWSHMAIYTLGISHSTHVIGTGNINRIFSNIYTTTFPRSCAILW